MSSFLGKRQGGDNDEEGSSSKAPSRGAFQDPTSSRERVAGDVDMDMECEDLIDDQIEDDEGEVIDCADELDPEKNPPALGDAIPLEEDDDEGMEEVKAWRPEDGLQEGEVLDFDASVYEALHQMSLEWPCMSFDFIPDQLGAIRKKFPHSLFFTAGSQADKAKNNKLYVVKVSDIHKTRQRDDMDEDDDDSDDDLDDDPVMEWKEIPVYGATNRIRCMPQKPNLVATWNETGKVHVFDVKSELNGLGYYGEGGGSGSMGGGSSGGSKGKGKGGKKNVYGTPVFSFEGHSGEGYALGWSHANAGHLLSGDQRGNIYLTKMNNGKFMTEREPFVGHSDSVEDVQWSPAAGEGALFASCSVDKSVRLWDSRTRKANDGLWLRNAHDADVNVLSWNKLKTFLIASGGDDGAFKVWDLRMFGGQSRDPLIAMQYHKQPITSIEWHPEDESVLICGCSDNQTTIWDMDMKKEDEELGAGQSAPSVPSQLLFVHQGQQDVKEVHWHPQIPGLLGSTALDNFHIFKTINS